jgi:hypothetical protein
MQADFSHLLIPLRNGAVLHRCGGKGRGIAVFKGQVWLTQSGDHRDLILAAGESFDFDRPGIVVVQAFADASVVWFEGTGHEPDRALRDDPLRRADGSRITAFALQRAARDMRNAAIARALLRAAGAASFAWTRAVLALRSLQHRLAAMDDCRELQRG